ncbi:MAG TPA: hypothetical protein VJJ52_01195 [Candidatus Nanoarchaeia archaeon]|nr:hypothetical protein [Candidatus Nanoarchaeia archaeon]
MNRKEVDVRRNYLDILDRNMASFKKGSGKNIALLGSRKCGKTLIVKEHLKNVKDAVPIYIDFEKISLNPENFSVEFVGNIIFHFLKKPPVEYKKYLLLENLIKSENELKSKNSFSLIKTIENELLKIKPDQRALVDTAFKFSETLAKENNIKFLIVLDNFENIFDLNNFSQIKDVLSLLNLEAENVRYIATSSAIKQSLASLKKFECYEIKNLERKESIELSESIIGKNDKANEEIFKLSWGHPLINILISNKYNEIKDVKKAFLIELLQKDNSIYDYCFDSLNNYYNRARGQTLLKTILRVVANEELRLSDIAKKIYRSAPVTKSILERLMEVDVIYKKDNKFYFTDNVLRVWLKLISHGYEFDDIPDDKILNEAMKEL